MVERFDHEGFEQKAQTFYNVRFFDTDWNEIEELAALDQPLVAASLLVGEFLVAKSSPGSQQNATIGALLRACECTVEVCLG